MKDLQTMENDSNGQPRVWVRAVKRLLRIVVLTYITALVFAMGFADKMIFHPPAPGYEDGPGVIKITTPAGERISAVHLTAQDGKFTILLSHGNAEDIGYGRETQQMFVEHGYNVFAYDYRGYGTSEGRPTEKNVYEDVQAAYDYLVKELKVRPERIIALGRSVGSGPATYLAGREPVAGLVLESPFMSVFRVVTGVRLLPFDKFDNLSRIDKVDCPVLITHGRADNVVTFRHGEKLFDKAKEPKFNLWIDGAGHNDFYRAAGERYFDALRQLTSANENGNMDPGDE